MDDKKKLTNDELEKVTGGSDDFMFCVDKRKHRSDESPEPEIPLSKDKLDDIPPSGREYTKLPF